MDKSTPCEIRMAGLDDLEFICAVDSDIFDFPVERDWAREFLQDPRHHLAIAVVDGRIIGMASGIHYLHPDKASQLFITEAGVDVCFQGRGVGRKLIRKLCEHGAQIGCTGAWVATENTNEAARKCYTAAGGRESNDLCILYEYPLTDT